MDLNELLKMHYPCFYLGSHLIAACNDILPSSNEKLMNSANCAGGGGGGRGYRWLDTLSQAICQNPSKENDIKLSDRKRL